MDVNTHQQLRSRLQQQAQQAETPPLVPDWAGSALPPQHQNQSQRLAATVQALKQRSLQVTQTVPGGTALANLPASPPAAIALCQQRLTAMAERINTLSQQQQQAIVDMQHTQAQLQRLWPHHYPHQAPPQLDVDQAYLAHTGHDGTRTLWVGYRPLIPPPDAATTAAHTLAHHLRQRPESSGPEPVLGPRLTSLRGEQPGGLMALLHEPLALGQACGKAMGQGVRALLAMVTEHLLAGHTEAPSWGGLGWVDVVMWVAGGVVAQLVLNGLLAVFPGLWTVAVALITGLTAFALYQATLAPRLRFGLAYRVFLALAGLILAGRL